MFENIADVDDSHKLIAVLDRHMADPQLRHQLHHMGNRSSGEQTTTAFVISLETESTGKSLP